MKKSFTPVQVAELIQAAILGVVKNLQAQGIQINLAIPQRKTGDEIEVCSTHNEQKRQGDFGPYCFSCMKEKKIREGTWQER